MRYHELLLVTTRHVAPCLAASAAGPTLVWQGQVGLASADPGLQPGRVEGGRGVASRAFWGGRCWEPHQVRERLAMGVGPLELLELRVPRVLELREELTEPELVQPVLPQEAEVLLLPIPGRETQLDPELLHVPSTDTQKSSQNPVRKSWYGRQAWYIDIPSFLCFKVLNQPVNPFGLTTLGTACDCLSFHLSRGIVFQQQQLPYSEECCVRQATPGPRFRPMAQARWAGPWEGSTMGGRRCRDKLGSSLLMDCWLLRG